MALADAGVEIPKLAVAHGFAEVATHRRTVAYTSLARMESFSLTVDEDGRFESAQWSGQTLWKTAVDRRRPGERSERDGLSLAATAQRRSVGLDEVRPVMVRSIRGMAVGYMDLKRRIKNSDWTRK